MKGLGLKVVKDPQGTRPYTDPKIQNPTGPCTQYSYTYPKSVLKLLLPKSQVPNYWVLGPLGEG